jgi:predicted Fe-Mo cluster-binding NifX family protein
MKIAVTSQNRRTVTDHAGVCRKFWVYDIPGETAIDKQLLELTREQAFRNAESGASHPLDGVQVVITGGTGPGLVRRLAERGMGCVITNETDPDTAARAFARGALVEKPAARSGHRRRCGHGSDHYAEPTPSSVDIERGHRRHGVGRRQKSHE